MKSVGSLVWAVLFGGLFLGLVAIVALRGWYGPQMGPAQGLDALDGVRQIDARAESRLADLGVRFHEAADGAEPNVDLQDPSDADFGFLEQVLRSNDPKGRVSAAKVMRDIDNPRSVEPLIGAIRGIDDIDRYFLDCALTIVNHATAEQRLAVLVPAWERHKDDLPDFAKEALRLKLRDIGALDPDWLREAALGNPDPLVRRFAVRELAARPSRPRGVLGAALADPDDEVRVIAAGALSNKT